MADAAATLTASQAPVGSGMAAMAKNTIMMKKAYDQHVMDAQENGDTPLPFADWMKQQQAIQAAAKKDQTAGYNEATK